MKLYLPRQIWLSVSNENHKLFISSGKVWLYQVHIEMQVKSETLGLKSIVSNLFANIKNANSINILMAFNELQIAHIGQLV